MSDHAACPRPCSTCPWLTENHGKPHANGWYTKKNRNRLWAKLREGDSMSCHKTDEENPVPEGHPQVKPGTTVKECTGGLILQQREAMNFQAVMARSPSTKDTMKLYRAEHPRGMKRSGLVRLVERAIFGHIPRLGEKLTKPNLNEPVSHDGLNWKERK